MTKPTRESIFRDAGRRLRADFEEIRNNVPHRGEAGGEGESIVRKFFNEHLPGRFRATSGFILDKKDVISGHTDVIIYDSLNCPVYRTSERGMVIPNDNVAAVCEVKFNLSTTLLDSAIDKIHEAKVLAKTPLGASHEPGDQIATFGVIFAFECNLGFETIIDRWHAKLSAQNPLHSSVSMIVILDRGFFSTVMEIPDGQVAPVDLQGVSPAKIGTKVGVGYLEYKELTLDHMMRLMLSHLTFFRQRIDHPGFNFSSVGESPVKWFGEYTAHKHILYSKFNPNTPG